MEQETLQFIGLAAVFSSVAMFIAMHFVDDMKDRMKMLYGATGLGIVATIIGILT